MSKYVYEAIVSFYLTGSNGTDDGILELRYCPNCKICKDKELFRSYNKKNEYNPSSRGCLDKSNKYNYVQHSLVKTFSIEK